VRNQRNQGFSIRVFEHQAFAPPKYIESINRQIHVRRGGYETCSYKGQKCDVTKDADGRYQVTVYPKHD
jgi:hypothetical protein